MCTGGQACLGSVCSCGMYTLCSGNCTDTTMNSANCGACGYNCQPNGCSSGMCVPNWDNCGTALDLGEGLMFPGNNCGASDETGADCGTASGDVYYYSYVMTNGTKTISVTPMGPGSFVVGAIGTSCGTTVMGACGTSVNVTITTAPTFFYWVVKSLGACGEFQSGMT